MLRYAVSRCLQAFIVLLLVSIVAFGLLEMVPGDPVTARVGTELVDKEFIEQLRSDYKLDDPIAIRYLEWFRHAITGDLGLSTKTRTSVASEMQTRLPATLHIGIGSLVVGIIVGISVGVLSATRSNTLTDRVITVCAVAGVSIPEFFLGIVAILIFAVELNWLPASGYVPFWEDPIESVRHLILPCAILGIHISGILGRHTRSAMLEVLAQDYVRTARAKGLRESRVMIFHSLRNASIPIVTVLSLLVGRIFAGSVVIETVFSIPGVGRYLVTGVQNSDFPVVQTMLLLSAGAIVLVNVAADLAYGLLDPRIKQGVSR